MKGRRPDSYQHGSAPQGSGYRPIARAESPFHRLWSGPSALAILPTIVLGRCPRLVYSAPSALLHHRAKQLPFMKLPLKRQDFADLHPRRLATLRLICPMLESLRSASLSGRKMNRSSACRRPSRRTLERHEASVWPRHTRWPKWLNQRELLQLPVPVR